MKTHVALWSGPRNISTALMYSFAQRSDTRVFDEPLYGHFLNTYPEAWRPDRVESMRVMNLDGERVVRELFLAESERPVVFTKNIACHISGLNWSFLSRCKNVLLIREPAPVIASYTRNIQQPSMLDLAYEVQREIWNVLNEQGQPPVVIDSKEVLKNPEGMLRVLCHAVGIAFDASMLQWKAGARSEDGPWAKYWYHNVHRSTGFASHEPTKVTVPEHLRELEAQCAEHYNFLVSKSLKPAENGH